MSIQAFPTALGPLASLYEDPAVTEIMVDSPEQVSVERSGKLEDLPIRFDPPETLRAVIDAILELGGVTLKPGQTAAAVRLPDNRSLAQVILPPTALTGPYLVIRKTPFAEMTWELLFKYGSINQETYEMLQSAILARANILVAGGTASGKTTIMNRLAELVPPTERVVVVETFHEFQIHHPRAIYLEANATGIPMKDLLEASTRMRPDRIVVSELNSADALHVIEICNRGHDGGLMTIHSNSAEDALSRLEAMCLMANMGLGLGEIRTMIASALQVIVYQKYLPDGKRRIMDIVELRGIQDDRYILQPLMRYNPDTGATELTGVKPSWKA